MMIQFGKYQHYKNGQFYEVIGMATHSETLEEMVIYRALYNNTTWVRPKNMFFEEVYYNGQNVPRFRWVE